MDVGPHEQEQQHKEPLVKAERAADVSTHFQRRAVLRRFKAAELVVEDDLDFRPRLSRSSQCLVRIEAAPVQSLDIMVRSGNVPELGARPPFATGAEFVGVVEAAGSRAGIEVGTRVYGLTRVGAHARFIICAASALIPLPGDTSEGVSPAELALALSTWLTAYQLLYRTDAAGPVARREAIFVQGGDGLVGSALVKLALRAGCRVSTSVRGAERVADMEALGVTAFDFEEPGWWRHAREEMGDGVSVAFDGVGAERFSPSMAMLGERGLLQIYGAHAMVVDGHTGCGAVLGTVWNLIKRMACGKRKVDMFEREKLRRKHPRETAQDVAAVLGMLRNGELHFGPVETVRFEEINDAHRRLESGGVRAALILDPNDVN